MPNLVPGDIPGALTDLGIVHTVSDEEASACCPFHSERHPSWGISLKTGLWNCFTCGEKGNFAQLVSRLTKQDRNETRRWILERKVRSLTAPDEPVNVAAETDTTKIMNEAKLWRFTDPPSWARTRRDISLRACQKYGVLWDEEMDQWITPIRDPDTNEIWGWQAKDELGRYFSNNPRGVQKSRTLFGLACFERATIRSESQAIIVESPLDILRLEDAGLSGGLAAFGARVSAEQLRILARVASSVVLCLDDDRDGQRRTAEIVREFTSIRTYVFAYPGTGKDPGEWSVGSIRRGVQHADAGRLWLSGWRAGIPPWER